MPKKGAMRPQIAPIRIAVLAAFPAIQQIRSLACPLDVTEHLRNIWENNAHNSQKTGRKLRNKTHLGWNIMVFGLFGIGRRKAEDSQAAGGVELANPAPRAPAPAPEAATAVTAASTLVDTAAPTVRPDWSKQYPPGTPTHIDPDQYTSMLDLVQAAVDKYAAQPAIILGPNSLTYAQIGAYAKRFSAYLRTQLEVQKGDRVAVMTPNLPAFPIALFGVWKSAAVQVNVNPLYTPTELKHQLNDSGSTVLVIADLVLPTFNAIAAETGVKSVIIIDTKLGASHEIADGISAIVFDDAIAQGADDLPDVPVQIDDVAVLQYTGGTTGVSKGATLTHRNLVANMLQAGGSLKAVLEGEDLTVITALPLYHIFALTVNLLLMFHFGAKNHLIPNPRDIDAFAAAWKAAHPVSFMSGVNTLYQGLTAAPQFADVDFSTVKIAVGGGAACQRVISDRWHARSGRHIVEGYGLSETSPVVTLNNPFGENFSGGIGVPAPSTDVSIRDDDGNELPLGESGEICVKGPQVMRGYWERPEETAKCMTDDGYFRTGDIGFMNDDGFLFINDRKKDMVLVSGFNVFPNEVEDVVAKMDAVVECACIGIPDEKTGEAVRLFVVKASDIDEDTIIAHCREHLAAYKVPKSVVFIDELPKSAVGKILRRELRNVEVG